MYREIMRSKTLTPEAKAIYAYLCSFAGDKDVCYPGTKLMMEELQMSSDRFYKHMQLLTDAGIVHKIQERKGNRWGNVIYKINHTPNIQFTENTCTQNTITENTCTQNDYINNNSLNNNSLNKYKYGQNMDFDQLLNELCKILNSGRKQRKSKGRLKISNTAKWYVEELIKAGYEPGFIIEVAFQVGSMSDADWFDLRDAVLERKGK